GKGFCGYRPGLRQEEYSSRDYRRQCGLSASCRSLISPPNIDLSSSRLAAKFRLPAAVARLSLPRFVTARLHLWCRRVNKAICRASESHAAKILRPFFSHSRYGCVRSATVAHAHKAKTAAGATHHSQLSARRRSLHRAYL